MLRSTPNTEYVTDRVRCTHSPISSRIVPIVPSSVSHLHVDIAIGEHHTGVISPGSTQVARPHPSDDAVHNREARVVCAVGSPLGCDRAWPDGLQRAVLQRSTPV